MNDAPKFPKNWREYELKSVLTGDRFPDGRISNYDMKTLFLPGVEIFVRPIPLGQHICEIVLTSPKPHIAGGCSISESVRVTATGIGSDGDTLDAAVQYAVENGFLVLEE